jgi:hypothetical protein
MCFSVKLFIYRHQHQDGSLGSGVLQLCDCILLFIAMLTDLSSIVTIEHEIRLRNGYFNNNSLIPCKLI